MADISSLQRAAYNKEYYVLTGEDDSIKRISRKHIEPSKETIFATAEKLYTLASDAFKSGSKDFKLLASISYDYTNRHFKALTTDEMTHYQNFGLLLREKLPTPLIRELFESQSESVHDSNSDNDMKHHWAQIVFENRLYHQFHSADTQLVEGKLSLPIGDQMVEFAALDIEKGENEVVFYLDGEEVLKTNSKGVFKGYHFHGASGIIKGTYKKPEDEHIHKPYFKKEATGQHHVWICTAIKSLDSPACIGDHSYLGLEDKDGNVTFYGQFGTEEDVQWYNFAKHWNVGAETPDRYIGLPLTNYVNTRTRKAISEADFQTLRTQVEDDLKNGMRGSFLIDNCTRYVTSRLEKIGIDIDVKMTNIEWLGRKCLSVLPKNIGTKIFKSYEKLPQLAKKVLHVVIIPFYIINLFGNFLFWATSIFSEKKMSDCDVNLLDVVFRPWNVYSNHPLKLYEWQKGQPEEQNA